MHIEKGEYLARILVTRKPLRAREGIFRRGIGPLASPLTSSCLIFTSVLPSSVTAIIDWRWIKRPKRDGRPPRDLRVRDIVDGWRSNEVSLRSPGAGTS